jgi:hypothetical protein
MHRPACSRSHRRWPRTRCPRRPTRTRTLEDRPSSLNPGRRTRRSRINRPRSSLRHHHTPNRNNWACRLNHRRLHHFLHCLNLRFNRCRSLRRRNHRSSRRRHHRMRNHLHRRSRQWRRNRNRRSGLRRSRLCVRRRNRNHRRPRNHCTRRRPARNRRCRRSHNLRASARLRHNPPRRRSSRSRRHRRGRSMCRTRLNRRPRWSSRSCRRHRPRRNHSRRTRRRRTACIGLSLLARQNRLQRIPRLRDVREIERRLRFHPRLRRRGARSLALEIVAHLLGLIGLNRTRVRLRLSHANRRQSVQNGPALDFHFACEIVDSNFAHPSLFISPARLAVHISLIEEGICVKLYYPRNRNP